MKRGAHLHTGVPIAELIAAIGIFMIAAVLVVRMFVMVNSIQNKAGDLSHAIMEAQTIAEYQKGTGSTADWIKLLEEKYGTLSSEKDSVLIGLDDSWNPVSEGDDLKNPPYEIRIKIQDEKKVGGTLVSADIEVVRKKPYLYLKEDGHQLFELKSEKYYGEAAI